MSATQIAGQITSPTDISAVQALGNSIAANVSTPISPAVFTFWAGFDGTNNIASDPAYSGDTQSTAVGALYKQISDASQATSNINVGVGYYAGVGTPGTLPGSSLFPTQQAIATATKAYNEFSAAAETWLQSNPGGSVTTMLASFSRGSIAAAVFSQMLYEKGLVALDGTMLVPPGQVGVSAGLVISPVNTGGNGDVPFAPNVQNMVEIVAANEYRIAYEQDIYAGFKRIDLLGNHGDVGGFYPGGLGSMYLQNYTDFFNAANPGMAANVLSTRQYTGGVLDIHVETFSPANLQNLSVGSYVEGSTIGTSTINPLGTSEATGTGDILRYVNYQGETVVVQRVGGMVQSVMRTLPAAGSITTHYDAGTGVTTQTVDTTLNGNALNVTYTYDAFGQPIPHVNSINGVAPTDQAAADAAFKNTGILPDQLIYGDSGVAGTDVGSVVSTFDATHPSGTQTLYQFATNYGTKLADALTLIRALQNGEPLPVVASGLKLATDLNANYNLAASAAVAGGLLAVMNLQKALERGDQLGAITAGSQAINYGAQAYLRLSGDFDPVSASMVEFFGGNSLYSEGLGIFDGGSPGAIAYINLVNDIASGDGLGATIDILAMVAPQIGIPLQIAHTVLSLFGFFDEEIPATPRTWGVGHYIWNGNSVAVTAQGESGGDTTIAGTMNQMLATLNAIIEQQHPTNPGASLGIIANRLPSFSLDTDGYHLTSIDPATGQEKNPALRYNNNGNPYLGAAPGSAESYISLGEAFLRNALERQAIAPMWEVETASKQTSLGDPVGGLSEEERAAQLGLTVGKATGATQVMRTIALDLDGDGIETVDKANSHVAFDVDDSGYFKSTAWVKGDDAFLTLDRNLNDSIDSRRELCERIAA